MTIWYIILGLMVVGLAYMSFEARNVKVERIVPSRHDSAIKVLQLSDIHINFLMVPVKKIKDIIDGENPDLIIITGDYINTSRDVPPFISFINKIKGDYRMLMCLGNHDYKAFKGDKKGLERFIREIKATGAELMDNESIIYEKGSKKFAIAGIADMRHKYHNIGKALKSISGDADVKIAFSHNPDIVLQFPEGSVDYLLTGHFHGGQIWAPFNIEFSLMRNEKLCKIGVTRGMHSINGINLYINRGLGNVLFPLRFLSRPEITVFRF